MRTPYSYCKYKKKNIRARQQHRNKIVSGLEQYAVIGTSQQHRNKIVSIIIIVSICISAVHSDVLFVYLLSIAMCYNLCICCP